MIELLDKRRAYKRRAYKLLDKRRAYYTIWRGLEENSVGWAEPGRAEPSQDEPSQAGPSRAEQSRARPSRAEPGRAGPSRAEPGRAEPSRWLGCSLPGLLAGCCLESPKVLPHRIGSKSIRIVNI